LVTVFAREVVPRVRSKEKGDLLMGCERGAGKGIVSKEVGEGRGYGVALWGVVGAGKDHMEFVTEGVGGAVRAVAKLVGDVPAGVRGEELVGSEGTALASQTKEGDGGECGEKAEIERGAVQVLALCVHGV
jgi:hypothetical protein